VGSEVEQELDDRWWLGLRGRPTESVDAHEFHVIVSFGGQAALTIESTAIVQAAARSLRDRGTPGVMRNDDGTITATQALVSLVGLRVESAVGFKTGDLRLVFESGARLVVPFDDRYEAWQLTGPSGRTWVSLPGVGLATFPAP
jgi:hypothetical protein